MAGKRFAKNSWKKARGEKGNVDIAKGWAGQDFLKSGTALGEGKG